jgi:hypothetical protein
VLPRRSVFFTGSQPGGSGGVCGGISFISVGSAVRGGCSVLMTRVAETKFNQDSEMVTNR